MKARLLYTACFIIIIGINASTTRAQDFAFGADPSWYTQMEADGVHFYNADGAPVDVPSTLAAYGFDSIRLRLWVNPENKMSETGGYCGLDDVTTKAKRATELGQRVMLDFHFSDGWADPGQQNIPAAWANLKTPAELTAKISEYVTSTLTHLRSENVNIAWVQIGNETSNGMLYPYAQFAIDNTTAPSRVDNFISFFNAAATATRAIYPEAKTVCHLNKGYDWGLYNWFFGEIAKRPEKLDCDYIGMSLYPIPTWGYEETDPDYFQTSRWQKRTDGAITTAINASQKYGMRIMVSEVGMPNTWTVSVPNGATSAVREAQCNADVADFLAYLVDRMKATGVCDGFFYWEPECNYFNNYPMGALTSSNRPNAAWDYVKSISPFTGIEDIKAQLTGPSILIIDGRVIVDGTPDPAARVFIPDGRPAYNPTKGSIVIVSTSQGVFKTISH